MSSWMTPMMTRGFPLLLLLALAPGATAREGVTERQLADVRRGERIRITDTEGATLAGRFVGVEDGVLILDGPPRRIPIASLSKARLRGRATQTGAIVGGVAGAAAVGLFGAALVTYACEYTCGGSEWVLGALVGAAVGGAGGASSGALVGAALPRWHRLEKAGSMPRGRIGSATLGLGYHRAFDSAEVDGGLGARLGLTTEIGRVSPGLEYGRYQLGRGRTDPQAPWLSYDASLTHFGPTVRVELSEGPLRPYGILGAGHYAWTTFDPQSISPWSGVVTPAATRTFLGGSVGAGLRLGGTSAISLGVEGRWHTNLSGMPAMSAEDRNRRLSVVSLTAGANVSW